MEIKMTGHCAALTVAGSDSGGGAGIQADLKAFSALGVFGTSVITAITAQNLSGVSAILPVDPDVVRKQLQAVLQGFPIKAIKTGMLFSAEIIDTIADVLGSHYPPNKQSYKDIPLIVDPVFAATSGSKLIEDDAVKILKEKLFPLACLITPNMAEAEILAEIPLKNQTDLEKAGKIILHRFGAPVLMKGGHLPNRAVDILVDSHGIEPFESPLITDVNNHGSGCTLASSIAAAIARGEPLRKAVRSAKNYITQTLTDALPLSPNLRVMNHFPS